MLFDFLYIVLPELQYKANIYLSNAVKALILPVEHTPVASVNYDTGGNWLEVNFDMAGIDAMHIEDVLKSAVEKKRYHRLPDGTFLSLETAEFQSFNQMFDELNIKKL